MRTFISIDLLWRWSIFIRIIGVLKSFWVRDNRALFHPQFPIPAAATLHLCPCGLRGLLLLLSVDRWWRGIRVCRHRMRTSPGPIKEGDISRCNEAGERIARSLTRMGILYRKKHVGTWVYDSAASEFIPRRRSWSCCLRHEKAVTQKPLTSTRLATEEFTTKVYRVQLYRLHKKLSSLNQLFIAFYRDTRSRQNWYLLSGVGWVNVVF